MENQHRHIAGYRELGMAEIERLNSLKELEEKVLNSLETINLVEHDPRWLEQAWIHIQQGFMFACRSVARPIDTRIKPR